MNPPSLVRVSRSNGDIEEGWKIDNFNWSLKHNTMVVTIYRDNYNEEKYGKGEFISKTIIWTKFVKNNPKWAERALEVYNIKYAIINNY